MVLMKFRIRILKAIWVLVICSSNEAWIYILGCQGRELYEESFQRGPHNPSLDICMISNHRKW